MLTAAGFPQELRPFIECKALDWFAAERDGSLHFAIPSKEETKKDVCLEWHPDDPDTWAFEGRRFDVVETFYSDREHYSVSGVEYAPIETLDELIEFLEDQT